MSTYAHAGQVHPFSEILTSPLPPMPTVPDGSSAQPVMEPFLMDFGMKSAVEVVVDGVVGLMTEGFASKYSVQDLDQETQIPGSFRDVADSWGRQAKPMILWQHGTDPVLNAAPVGWGVKFELSDVGLYIKAFIPRDPTPPFTDNADAKNARWATIYAGIKAGRIRGYSVGGMFKRLGKSLLQWSTTEISLCANPCLPVATFVLGSKGVKAMMDSGYGMEDMGYGCMSLPAWSGVMKTAQKHTDTGLHDYLLNNYPAHQQGDHGAKDCAICKDRRGTKAVDAVETDGEPALTPASGKAALCEACQNASPGCAGCTCANCLDPEQDARCLCEDADEADEEETAGQKTLTAALETIKAFTAGVKAGKSYDAASLAKFAKLTTMVDALLASE